MTRIERLFLGIMVAISLVFLIWGIQSLSYTGKVAFGAGFVPINAAALLIFLCIFRFFQSRKHLPKKKIKEAVDSNISGLILTIILLLIAVIAMHWGSLLAPLAAVMILISKFVMRNTLKQSIMVTATTLLVIYVIFSVWLNLPIH